MNDLPSTGSKRRVVGANWPSLPRLPQSLRASPDAQAYDAEMQAAWESLRGQLDRLSLEARTPTSINTGSQNRTLGFNRLPSGVPVGSHGFRPAGPLDPEGWIGGRSAEGGVILPRLDGRRLFYQPVRPSEGREGDIWYDTDNLFRPYEYINGAWVDIFSDVPSLVGRIGRLGSLRGSFVSEFDPRALLAEVNARSEAILAEQQNRAAAIAEVERKVATAGSASADTFKLINAEVGRVRSRVAREEKARVDGDSALASAIELIEVSVSEDLVAMILEEAEARIDADGTITANLATEVSARTTGDSTLAASIVSEESARIAGDDTVQANLETEIAARISDDSALEALITTEASTRASADGTIAANLATEVAARSDGDDDLAADILTEQSARITEDGLIAADLLTEISARTSADSGLSALISSEASTRASADGSLAAEYVLNISTGGASGRRVTGFRVTNLGGAGGATEFVVQTDKFVIVDTSGNVPTTVFKTGSGQVYIDKAVITEVNAGAILAGTITAALSITSPTINGGMITGAALVITSTIGMRYSSDNGVYTITGGSDNGPTHGAQVDLAGNGLGVDGARGVLVLSAGNIGTSEGDGSIRFRTGDTERGLIKRTGELVWNSSITAVAGYAVPDAAPVHFTRGGANSYIVEDWGINLCGDGTHPIQIPNASLAVGFNSGGANLATGRIYFGSTDVYLYVSGGLLHVHDALGDRHIPFESESP